MTLAGIAGGLVAVFVQASALALVIALVDRLLRAHVRAGLRAALWWAVIVRLVLPPSFALPWSVSAPLVEHTGFNALAGSTETSLAGPWTFAALAVWLAVAFALAFVEVRRHRALVRDLELCPEPPARVRTLLAQLATELGLSRTPRVVVHDGFGSAALVGAFRPLLVVPARLLDAGAREDLEHALRHELAHCSRRDPLRALVVRAVRTVWWFHPAAWIAARRLGELREIACDAAVARSLGARADRYRSTLLRAAAQSLRAPADARVCPFVSSSSLILLRLAWLDRPMRLSASTERALSACLFAGFTLAVVPMACELGAALPADPLVRQAFARLQRAVDADERQNCLEVQAAARVLAAHQALTGEDLFARIH